ncbi:MAG TPA: MurR/RpiR family transcriptional regulator [Amycolatopsis sp.]|jgi:DNA-binding MurR/RpiR family transcriptional regulator|nr:MurR/RpiR family transcriptional regulator [Amycolatopsis sp.]
MPDDATPDDSLTERITGRLAGMSRAERTVAEYLRHHARDAIFATAEQIGEATGTSDATVVRTAKTLGFTGLSDLRQHLARQVVTETSPSLRLHARETGEAGGPPKTVLARVFTEATERLAETLRLVSEEDFERAVDLLDGAREVLAFGIGPSSFLAGYLALRLGRMGRRARSSGATGFRLADDLLGLGEGDVVVLFLPSRLLGDIEVLLDRTREVGASTLLITDSLAPVFGDRVAVSLQATHSPSNFTGEMLSAEVLADALLLDLASRDKARANGASELLTTLRSRLIQGDSRDYVPRRKSGGPRKG